GGKAFATVEAYHTVNGTWRALSPMPTARHGIQAAVCNGGVYVAAGGTVQGGAAPTDVHEVFFLGEATTCGGPAPVGFGKGVLQGATSTNPTTLQFGPDGRLYVGQQDGLIKAYTVARNGASDYTVTATETITSVRSIPNHNDDGTPNPSVNTRLITGMLVTGTATSPVLYVASSDPRIGAGPSGSDLDLDTNSSMVSRLTWTGSAWQKVDLVRGLPRSEENHAANGMALDPTTNTLYVAQGGNTNHGAPSNNFALLPEYALSAAVLSIDLDAIGSVTYDLPTLDDSTRIGSPDPGDPFGGNDGRNQARLVTGGPVQVHAPGFRNAYDLVLTEAGRMYTVDNGGNGGWGGLPVNEGPSGTCTNDVSEPGATDPDALHLVTGPGYYGGHPNPTRANRANTFDGQSPVDEANPVECDYRLPGVQDGALATFSASTNGLTEYTASNFGGAMDGDLLAAGFDNAIHRVRLDGAGSAVVQKVALFSSVGQLPLDVVAQGDAAVFPGTVWVADYGTNALYVFEPVDFDGGVVTCVGTDDLALDEDGDGYTNADEIDNGTDPCSAGDMPPDWDADQLSNRNDPDDDNDGQPDTSDPFAIDPQNGSANRLPFSYTWENDAPNPGGLLHLGFTGLMTNRTADYESLFDPANMTAGGAAGVVTVDEVPPGDALGATNTQQYGFQVGTSVPSGIGVFTAHTRIVAPFAGTGAKDNQSMGLFLGPGDQDNYAKLVTFANGSGGGIRFLMETNGMESTLSTRQSNVAMPASGHVDLYLTIDLSKRVAATVQPSFSVTTGGVTGPVTTLGQPQLLPRDWFRGSTGFAIGIISTSAGASPFPATWDLLEAFAGRP
ncbi:MAG TPA: hypothetical protein VHF25_15730, partial [Nitriliruptorales bacterium]|nr:hypothetical protein [Nitriliruptorales bacterium]